MGKQNRVTQISTLIFSCGCLCFWAVLPGFARADLIRPAELAFVATTVVQGHDLTTEKVLSLDPHAANPHRRRWAVQRSLSWEGLEAIPNDRGQYVPRAQGVKVLSAIHLRGAGPWYQGLEKLPCVEEPQTHFSTAESTEVAAREAVNRWNKRAQGLMLKLQRDLPKLHGDHAEEAFQQADRLLEQTRDEIQDAWSFEDQKAVEQAEWKFLTDLAKKAGTCPTWAKKPKSKDPIRWEDRVETPAPVTEVPPLFARAPARRWDGFYSIKVSIDFAGRQLTGQFLLDPEATASVVSPGWLVAQGVSATAVEKSNAKVVKVKTTLGGGAGKKMTVGPVYVGGQSIGIREFVMRDTEFFHEPKSISTCCDGVLGADFFNDRVLEFESIKTMNVVKIYLREGFALPAQEYKWREVGAGDSGVVEKLTRRLNSLMRGGFVVDLSHGRLWWKKDTEFDLELKNKSGIDLHFEYRQGGERVLAVRGIKRKIPGLVMGAIVQKIDGVDADELDQWDVNRRLAGALDKKVTLTLKKGKESEVIEVDVSRQVVEEP